MHRDTRRHTRARAPRPPSTRAPARCRVAWARRASSPTPAPAAAQAQTSGRAGARCSAGAPVSGGRRCPLKHPLRYCTRPGTPLQCGSDINRHRGRPPHARGRAARLARTHGSARPPSYRPAAPSTPVIPARCPFDTGAPRLQRLAARAARPLPTPHAHAAPPRPTGAAPTPSHLHHSAGQPPPRPPPPRPPPPRSLTPNTAPVSPPAPCSRAYPPPASKSISWNPCHFIIFIIYWQGVPAAGPASPPHTHTPVPPGHTPASSRPARHRPRSPPPPLSRGQRPCRAPPAAPSPLRGRWNQPLKGPLEHGPVPAPSTSPLARHAQPVTLPLHRPGRHGRRDSAGETRGSPAQPPRRGGRAAPPALLARGEGNLAVRRRALYLVR